MNSYIDVANLLLFLQCGEYEYLEDIVKFIDNNAIQAIPIPENATNGDMIKAMFPDCKDWKAKLEDNDGEVYEVHFVQLPNNLTVNKYEESWWNAPYKRGSEND